MWARDNGMDVPVKGPLPAEVRSAFATAQADGPPADPLVFGPPEADAGPVTFEPPAAASQAEGPPGETEPSGEGPRREQAPKTTGPKPPLERAREFLTGKRDKPAMPRPRSRRRFSLENIGTLAWAGLARAVTAAGEQYLPVSKMMTFQAPVMGMMIEDGLKGTVADKVLQPVARMMESGTELGAAFGLPAAAALVCRRPDLYPVVRPMMAGMMKSYIIYAGPKLRQMRAREEKFAEEMSRFSEDFGMTIDDILDEVFKPPEEMLQEMARASAAAEQNGQTAA